jgi:hypothetical protein
LTFEPVENIQKNSPAKLRAIPQKAFQKCFQNWKKCWEQCIGVEETTSKGTRLNNSQVNEIVLLKNLGNFPDSPHVLFIQCCETKAVTSLDDV